MNEGEFKSLQKTVSNMENQLRIVQNTANEARTGLKSLERFLFLDHSDLEKLYREHEMLKKFYEENKNKAEQDRG